MALFLTLLAAAAAQVHMLARPHVLSWLLTLLWMEILYRFEEGEGWALLLLPPLMLLWVNLHAGFVLGLGLLGVFFYRARLECCLSAPRAGDGRKIAQLAAIFGLCLLTTLLTPYGYKLQVHVYQYLSNNFLLNSIDEFTSPNFHVAVYGYFELFLLLVIAAGGERAGQRNRVAAGVFLPTCGALCGTQRTYIRHPYEPGAWASAGAGDLPQTR